MAKEKPSLLQLVYQDLRDAAMDWAKEERMDENCAFHGDTFWVQVARPASTKGPVFREAAERFLKKIEEDGLINDLLPVKFTITKSSSAYDVEGEKRVMGESKEQLLVTLLHELITSFQYAEESHYQDNGKVPPYSLKVSNGAGKVTIDMNMLSPLPRGASSDYTKATHRMMAFIHEFFDEHIIKPRVEATRTVGRATFHFYLDKLKEELSPNDLAFKVAEKLVELIRAEIKQKAANAATIELTRFNNGIPCIRARLANRSQLTRAGVQRIIQDVCDRELPPGNLLKLEPRYGGFGSASTASSIAAAIKPV